MQAAIEKEIHIDAPVEVVWHLVTEPEQIRQWFADEAEIELRVGSKGRLAFKSGAAYELQVEAVEPPHRFAFRWVRKPGLVVSRDNSLLVEFILQPDKGGTRLKIVESGFDAIDWSDEERARYIEDHSNGWQRIVGRLRDHAASIRT
jgi:uncharacterized protein YndB with AHSA1/START domain